MPASANDSYDESNTHSSLLDEKHDRSSYIVESVFHEKRKNVQAGKGHLFEPRNVRDHVFPLFRACVA
jgi:hypothetical protein